MRRPTPRAYLASRTPRPTRDATFPTSYARFEIDAKTQKLSIKIVDAVTDEVIREIPSEQVSASPRISSHWRAGPRSASAQAARALSRSSGGGVDRYV